MFQKPKKFNTLIFLGFFLWTPPLLLAQQVFRGQIVDQEDLSPVPFATLYLANTTLGTVSDEDGQFALEIPAGSYEVIIRFMGYETLTFGLNTSTLREQGYQIRLRSEDMQLDFIEVEEQRDPQWYKNLNTFRDNFLGFSANANNTKILNEKVLLMDSDSSPGELIMTTRAPILLKNTNLGYTVDYLLGQFSYSQMEGKVLYAGNQLFQSDSSMSKQKARRVEKARAQAYFGSIQHLIQSLYFGQAESQGYEFRVIQRIPNPERPDEKLLEEAKELYSRSKNQAERDSLELNYLSKASLPVYVRQLNTTQIPAGQLVREDEEGRKFLQIADLIEVTYTQELEEFNYVGKANIRERGFQKSILDQIDPVVEIFPNGNYSDTFGILLEGYMVWEKVGDLVPLDYLPEGFTWNKD
ncbi:carboxypeptidase-like regulatory domain-containing protein [Algoriphagus namhaensis]